MNERMRAILILTLVNALWGMSFPLMRGLNLQVDQHFELTSETASTELRFVSATWMIFLRFSVALLLFPLLFRSVLRQARRQEWLVGALIGSLFVSGLILQVVGLATIPASRSGFLTSMAVVFTPVVHSLIQLKLPSLRVITGVLIALTGIAILTGLVVWSDHGPRFAEKSLGVWTSGDTLTTVGAMFFTIQILCVDHFGKRLRSASFTPGMFTTVVVIAGTLCWIGSTQLPHSLARDWFELTSAPSFWGSLLTLSVFGSVLAFSWMNQYQPRVTAVQAAVIYTTEPVFASLWAAFLPGLVSFACGITYANEVLTLPLSIGGSLVLIANVLALWPSKTATSAEQVTAIQDSNACTDYRA